LYFKPDAENDAANKGALKSMRKFLIEAGIKK
jgi:hypothetical protein